MNLNCDSVMAFSTTFHNFYLKDQDRTDQAIAMQEGRETTTSGVPSYTHGP